MPDVHDRATRSRNMAAISGKNTKPELIIRKGLHAKGLRYRLHVKGLPGKPDLVFPKYNAALFVHGCFWHRHDCPLFVWPKTRREFWKEKILANVARDTEAIRQLEEQGWRVGTVWECALKGRYRLDLETVIDALADWIDSDTRRFEIEGNSKT